MYAKLKYKDNSYHIYSIASAKYSTIINRTKQIKLLQVLLEHNYFLAQHICVMMVLFYHDSGNASKKFCISQFNVQSSE